MDTSLRAVTFEGKYGLIWFDLSCGFWLADTRDPVSAIVFLTNSSKPLFWKIKSSFY